MNNALGSGQQHHFTINIDQLFDPNASSGSSYSQNASNSKDLLESYMQSIHEDLLVQKSVQECSMNYSNSIVSKSNVLSQRNNSLKMKSFGRSQQEINEDEVSQINKRSQVVYNQLVEVIEEQEISYQNMNERAFQSLQQLVKEKADYYKVEFAKLVEENDQYRQESIYFQEKLQEHLQECEGLKSYSQQQQRNNKNNENMQNEDNLKTLALNLQRKEEELDEEKRQIEVTYVLDSIINNVEKQSMYRKKNQELEELKTVNIELENKNELLQRINNEMEIDFNSQIESLQKKLEESEQNISKKNQENGQIQRELTICKNELQISQNQIERQQQTQTELMTKINSLEKVNNEFNIQIEQLYKSLKEREQSILQFNKERLDQSTLLQKLQEELETKNTTLERFKNSTINESINNNSSSINSQNLKNEEIDNKMKTEIPNQDSEINKLKLEIETQKDLILKLRRNLKIERMKQQGAGNQIQLNKRSLTPVLQSSTSLINSSSQQSSHNQSIIHEQSTMMSNNGSFQTLTQQDVSKEVHGIQKEQNTTQNNIVKQQDKVFSKKAQNKGVSENGLQQSGNNEINMNITSSSINMNKSTNIHNTSNIDNSIINDNINITNINNSNLNNNGNLTINNSNTFNQTQSNSLANITQKVDNMIDNDDISMIVNNLNHQKCIKRKHKSIDSTLKGSSSILGSKIFQNHSISHGYTMSQSMQSEGIVNQSLCNETANNSSMMLSIYQTRGLNNEEDKSQISNLSQFAQSNPNINTAPKRRSLTLQNNPLRLSQIADERSTLEKEKRKVHNKREQYKEQLKLFKKEYEEKHGNPPTKQKDFEPVQEIYDGFKKISEQLKNIQKKISQLDSNKESHNISVNSINQTTLVDNTINQIDNSMIRNIDNSIISDINNISTIKTQPSYKIPNHMHFKNQNFNSSQFSHNSFSTDQNQNTLLHNVSTQLADSSQILNSSTAGLNASNKADADTIRGLRLENKNLQNVNNQLREKLLNSIEFEKLIKIKEALIEKLQKELEEFTSQCQKKDEEINSFKETINILQEKLTSETKERKQLHNIVEDMKGKIRVFCRVRPPNEAEIQMNSQNTVDVQDQMTLQLQTKNGPKKFSFDSCLGFNSSQGEIFEDTKRLIQSAVDGYNVCIFAYGQTGSGKTFTMQGTRDDPGITPRSINELFSLLKPIQKTCKVTISTYLIELYMDNLIDLLAPSNNPLQQQKLKIKEDYITNTTYVQNATVASVSNKEELEQIMKMGMQNRKVSRTEMNIESSRSHLIITILLSIYNPQNETTTHGKISLIDLAGSERILKSGANPHQIKEAQAINVSLTALGDVISALTTQSNNGERHIPYRNNKLTYLMKDSLGGNAKTLMFVNVSPSEYNQEETQSSLYYASRVKTIVNDTNKNIETKEYTRLKEKLNLTIQENEKLQQQISDQNKPPSTFIVSNGIQQSVKENKQPASYQFNGQSKTQPNEEHNNQGNNQSTNIQQNKVLFNQQNNIKSGQQQKPSQLANGGRHSNNSSYSQQQMSQIIYNQQIQSQQQQQQKGSLNQNQNQQVNTSNSQPSIQITSQQLYGQPQHQKSSSVAPLNSNLNYHLSKINQQSNQINSNRIS